MGCPFLTLSFLWACVGLPFQQAPCDIIGRGRSLRAHRPGTTSPGVGQSARLTPRPALAGRHDHQVPQAPPTASSRGQADGQSLRTSLSLSLSFFSILFLLFYSLPFEPFFALPLFFLNVFHAEVITDCCLSVPAGSSSSSSSCRSRSYSDASAAREPPAGGMGVARGHVGADPPRAAAAHQRGRPAADGRPRAARERPRGRAPPPRRRAPVPAPAARLPRRTPARQSPGHGHGEERRLRPLALLAGEFTIFFFSPI